MSAIPYINKTAFKSLHKLRELEFYDCNMQFDLEHIPFGVFDDFINLETLMISQLLLFEYQPVAKRDDLFINLTSVTELEIDVIFDGVPFGQGFSNLKSLEELTLSCLYPMPGIIANNTFNVFQRLRLVKLFIHCMIKWVDPLAVYYFNLPHLRKRNTVLKQRFLFGH